MPILFIMLFRVAKVSGLIYSLFLHFKKYKQIKVKNTLIDQKYGIKKSEREAMGLFHEQ